jgi:ATP-binding cassette subfamily F protein uup
VKEASPSSTAPTAKRRLSFKDKHALETLPKTMAKLQAEIAKLQAQLDDPTLYSRDRKTFDAASAAMTKAHADLAAAEEQWLELEILREDIESGT